MHWIARTSQQDRDPRRPLLFKDFMDAERKGTYWLISWPLSKFRVANALPVAAGWAERLGNVRTRLDPFSDDEQRWLINWGYALCDAAVRDWVEDSAVRAEWPFPERALVGQ